MNKFIPKQFFLNEQTRQSICDIVGGITTKQKWVALELIDDLVLLSFDQKCPSADLYFMRGMVVSLTEKKIVIDSFGFAPSIVSSEIKDGLSIEGLNIPILDNAIFYKGVEGTVLRIWYHNKKIRYSTHRRLDASNSKWANSKPFPDIFHDMCAAHAEKNGTEIFNVESLFDMTKDSSAYCYFFVLSDISLTLVSEPQGLYFLGARSANKTEETVKTQPFPLLPIVSREEGAVILKDGGFLTAYQETPGVTGETVKIFSPKLYEKLTMRGSAMSVKFRIYELWDLSSKKQKIEWIIDRQEQTRENIFVNLIEHLRRALPEGQRLQIEDADKTFFSNRLKFVEWLLTFVKIYNGKCQEIHHEMLLEFCPIGADILIYCYKQGIEEKVLRQNIKKEVYSCDGPTLSKLMNNKKELIRKAELRAKKILTITSDGQVTIQ